MTCTECEKQKEELIADIITFSDEELRLFYIYIEDMKRRRKNGQAKFIKHTKTTL